MRARNFARIRVSSADLFDTQPIGRLPSRSRRASMAHAQPHPQARQRSAGDLARPLGAAFNQPAQYKLVHNLSS
jgi:hypothetical protein